MPATDAPTKPAAASEVTAPAPRKNAPKGGLSYQVRPGDTAAFISDMFAVSESALLSRNRFDSRSDIRAGDVIWLGKERTDKRASNQTTYQARKGDILADIAHFFGVDTTQLAKDNGLGKPEDMKPGQLINIAEIGASTRGTQGKLDALAGANSVEATGSALSQLIPAETTSP
jgi:LysM repeat protein